jgi:hypothetical protein
MRLGKEQILLCVKPLYAIPESGLHWFMTYSDHHRDRIGLLPSKGDIVLFRKRDCGGISLTALQLDDSFGHGMEISWLRKKNRVIGLNASREPLCVLAVRLFSTGAKFIATKKNTGCRKKTSLGRDDKRPGNR